MALWEYEIEHPDGTRETRMLAAGNRNAAAQRAREFAQRLGAQIASEPRVTDKVKGSL